MLLGHRESSELAELISVFEVWLRERSGALDPSQRELLQTQLVSRLSVIDARLSQGDEQESVRLLRSFLIEVGALSGTRLSVVRLDSDTLRGEPMGNTRSSVQRNGRLTSLLDVLGLRKRAAPLVTYPTLRVPSVVRERTVFFVEVAAHAQPSLDGGGGGDGRVSLTRHREGESVDLEISVELPESHGLTARSVQDAVLHICPDGRAAQIQFELYAEAIGNHSVTVVFRRDGLELTRISRTVSVKSIAEITEPPSPVTFVSTGLSAGSRFTGLVLRIHQRGESGDRRLLQLALGGPAWAGPPLEGEVSLPGDAHALLGNLCRSMERTLKITNRRAREQSMQGIGAELSRTLLPQAIRDVLIQPRWKEGAALHIESDDAWIPWEALFLGEPSGMRGGQPGFFLGEHFAVTRWLKVGSAREQVGGSVAVMIAPTSSGLSVGQERAVLQEITGQAPIDLMALGDVQQCLRGSPRAQVIHFACHGQSKAAEVIAEALYMQDGELHATDIPIPSPGTVGPIEGALVFLNACQAGIEERGLWSHSGWASKLLYAGVGAVVAPSWTITDAGALGFAECFYRNAHSGLSLSESARLARKQIGHTGNLDRIGYAVYAMPNAVANFAPKAKEIRECV